MPHFPKPFFKKARSCWYVEIDRKQHNLGGDKVQAFERYHELMRSRPKVADVCLAVCVIDAFLDWVRLNRSKRSFEWYQRHCQIFARSIPPLLSVGQLKKNHLTQCLAGLTDWSSTTRNGLCRAVCRAFQWAEDEELILRSPLARFKKPKCKRREVFISPNEFEYLLSLCRNDGFRGQGIHVKEIDAVLDVVLDQHTLSIAADQGDGGTAQLVGEQQGRFLVAEVLFSRGICKSCSQLC